MNDAAATLEAILVAENDALERHDAETAVALLQAKSAAARELSPENMTEEEGERLRDLAERNQELLERALQVQSDIVSIVVRAARSVPTGPRYGAGGSTIPGDHRNALIRQA